MREMSKILLSACTVCALGAAAHADPNQVPGQVPPPIPSDKPAPGSPNEPMRPPTDMPSPAIPPPPATEPSATPIPEPAPVAPAPPVTVTTDVTSSDDTNVYGYHWHEPSLASGIGVSTIIGGGVAGFTDRTMRSTTSDVGGLWGARIAIGSHLPLALELGYTGSATNINGLPTGNKGTLIGTTAEGTLRWNVLPHYSLTPYVFAGAGWQRYDVTQTSVSLSDSGMNDHDNLLVFPMGTGVAYRMGGFVADVRGTFRAATEQDLVLKDQTLLGTTNSNDFAPMHTWEASAALGYEF